MAVHDLPKVETRVRFPSLAQMIVMEISCPSESASWRRRRVACPSGVILITEEGIPLRVLKNRGVFVYSVYSIQNNYGENIFYS